MVVLIVIFFEFNTVRFLWDSRLGCSLNQLGRQDAYSTSQLCFSEVIPAFILLILVPFNLIQ